MLALQAIASNWSYLLLSSRRTIQSIVIVQKGIFGASIGCNAPVGLVASCLGREAFLAVGDVSLEHPGRVVNVDAVSKVNTGPVEPSMELVAASCCRL